jgi:tRNA modification GTPase
VQRARDVAAAADLRVIVAEGAVEGEKFRQRPEDIVRTGKDDDGASSGISGVSGFGVDEMLRAVDTFFSKQVETVGLATTVRHREIIESAIGKIELVMTEISNGVAVEFLSESVRTTIFDLDWLIGRVDVEDVLGDIFSNFCVGK